MLTVEPPELVRVSESVWLWPTCTLPKLRLDAAALSDPGVVPPVPVSGIVRLGTLPLLRMVMLPLATPLAGGVKVTPKVTVRPHSRVRGRFNPLMLNPAPVTITWLMMSGPPTLLIVTYWVVVPEAIDLPEATVPKSILGGFTVTEPGVAPLPWTLRLRSRLEASLMNPNVPSTCPSACGLKLTLKGTLCPEDKVRGKLKPLMSKPEPAGLRAETVIGVEPSFVRVAGVVVVWPTNTKPNHIWPGLQLSVPAPAGDAGVVDPA